MVQFVSYTCSRTNLLCTAATLWHKYILQNTFAIHKVAQGVKVAYFVLISCALGSKYTSKWNQMPFAGDSVGTITRLKPQWLIVLCAYDTQVTPKQVYSGKSHHMAGQSAQNPGNSSHATTNNTNSEGQFQPFRRLLRSHKQCITRINGPGRRGLHLPEV